MIVKTRSWPRSMRARPYRTPSTRRQPKPKLRFSPYAWAKLLFLRDLGPTEIGGFGICDSEDLLLVTDFVMVRQVCTPVTVVFDDEAVADFFEDQVNVDREPEQFARIWIHTHPGESAYPSGTDEETFRRCFGTADWAVMFILAEGGETYARFRCNVGPGMNRRLEVSVDYGVEFRASSQDHWMEQYHDLVTVHEPFFGRPRFAELSPLDVGDLAG